MKASMRRGSCIAPSPLRCSPACPVCCMSSTASNSSVRIRTVRQRQQNEQQRNQETKLAKNFVASFLCCPNFMAKTIELKLKEGDVAPEFMVATSGGGKI